MYFDPLEMDFPSGRRCFPQRAIIAFTRKERSLLETLRPGGRTDRPLAGGMTAVTLWPDLVLAGPVLGAPQAAMVMETLGRGGVQSFLSLGWCGALAPNLSLGDIVLPTSAVVEEGTSAHYPAAGPDPDSGSGNESNRSSEVRSPAAPDLAPDPGLVKALTQALDRENIPYRPGPVWTTDAPFRETREKVRRYGGQGVLAVDMETSALMAAARFRNLAWAGLMVVSDELWGPQWRPGFKSAELNQGLEQAARIILTVLDHE
jgi:uridine phosphorylase